MLSLKTSLIAIVTTLLFLLTTPAIAAELYLNPAQTTAGSGGVFKIDIRLNTDNQEINAIEGYLYYPAGLIVKAVSTGQSIISFWVSPPGAASSLKPGFKALSFSGLSPGGITTSNGLVASIIFQAPTSTESKKYLVSLDQAKVLLNDGAGTATALALKNVTLTLSPLAPVDVAAAAEQADNQPPENFSVAIARNPSIYNNQWFAAFVTTDKQSGIDHYEIQESANPAPTDNAWILAKNPALLRDQSRHSYVFVRAIDRSGQTKVAMAPPYQEKVSYSKVAFWCILLLVVSALSVRIFAFWRRQQTHVEPHI